MIARRKTLLTLLKEYVKIEEEGEQPEAPEGKAFHTRPWCVLLSCLLRLGGQRVVKCTHHDLSFKMGDHGVEFGVE